MNSKWCEHGNEPGKCERCYNEHMANKSSCTIKGCYCGNTPADPVPLKQFIQDGVELMKDFNIFAAKKIPQAVDTAVTAAATFLDEVDPVAEAEVYNAYGRTGQAIEILREALQKNPSNFKAHKMLSEIDPTFKPTLMGQPTRLNPNCRATFNSTDGWQCDCEHKHPLVCAKAMEILEAVEPFQDAINLLNGAADAEEKELAAESFSASGSVSAAKIKNYRTAAEKLKKANMFNPKTYTQHGSGMIPAKGQAGDWVKMEDVRKWNAGDK